MCLAVPAKIVELDGQNAIVDLQGVKRQANVAFIDNPSVGDYVLMHAGFAIRKWSEEDVQAYKEVMADAG
jgi:hydrogenase expression/formation protein HypC